MTDVQTNVAGAPAQSDARELLQQLLAVPQDGIGASTTTAVDHSPAIVEPVPDRARMLLQQLLELPYQAAARDSLAAEGPRAAVSPPVLNDTISLLQSLLETVPATPEQRTRLVMLRSIDSQRQLVQREVQAAQAFDRLLLRAQQFLLVGAVLAGGYWFADGLLRDWLHVASKRPPAMAVARPQTTAGAVVQQSSFTNAVTQTARLDARTATPLRITPTTGGLEASQPMAGESYMKPQQDLLLTSQISSPTPSPTPQILPPVAEPTHLLIPAIGIDTAVVEVFPVDDTWQTAEYAAGYMHGTARAGEAGNMGIAGHLGLRGAVFLNLGALQPGADIFVDAAGWRYHYRTRGSQVVWPNQIEVLFPEETTTLTLITCTNWDTQRLVVTGDLIGWELLSQ